MKPKSMILFLVAAGFGLVAMLGVMQALEAKPDEEPQVNVLIATVKIPPGVPLDESNTTFKTLPASAAPQGAVLNRDQTVGKALLTHAVIDDVITEQKLSADAFSPSSGIPPGMRAETISVDASMSHSGLLRPGDRVDVLCTYRITEFNRQLTKTKLILEYVEVFASDNRRSTADSEGDAVAKHVTLLVTPEDALLLNLTKNRGKLSLTLRSKLDDEVVDVATVTDAILDDSPTSHGEREDEDEPVVVAPPTPVVVAVAPEEPAEPEIPKWRMTIFAGDDVRDFEVIDDDALRAMGLDAAARRDAYAATRRGEKAVEADLDGEDVAGDDAGEADGFDKPEVDADAELAEPEVDSAEGEVDSEGEGGWVDAGLDLLESL